MKKFLYIAKLFLITTLLFFHSNLFSQDLNNLSKTKPVKIFGSFGVGGWLYNHSGTSKEQRRVPYSWYLNGSPTLQIYSFTFPFSFTVSEQQRDFSQPFNQFGVSPYYKWFTAHLGYRNMMFSQFTLAGQTFLGAGVELNPGLVRVGACYGRFRKAVALDSNSSDYRLPNLFPTYKRIGYAAKVGVGNKANFVDLIAFRGWDDENSLNLPDSLIGSTPGDNVCFGIKMNFNPIKNVLIDVDAGTSALTLDKRRNDSLGDLLNEIPGFAQKLIALNYSTRVYFGGQAGVSYTYKKFRIKALYKYIEPDYQSFGSNYIQGDVQDITLSPSISMAKGKMNVSATVGQRNDNLQGYKTSTTTRTLLNFNLNANVNKHFGMGLNYGNFGSNQQNGRVILNDSVRVSNVNQNIGVNLRFQSFKSNKTKLLMLIANYSSLDDRNEFTRQFTQSKVTLGSVNYAFNNTKKLFGYSLSGIISRIENRSQIILATGPSAGFNVSNKKQNLKINVNSGYQLRFSGANKDGAIANLNSDLNYSINKKNTFTIGVYVIRNTSSANSIYTFNEQRLILRYMYSF